MYLLKFADKKISRFFATISQNNFCRFYASELLKYSITRMVTFIGKNANCIVYVMKLTDVHCYPTHVENINLE